MNKLEKDLAESILVESLLKKNVIPLYFKGKNQDIEELDTERLGTGFIIGSIGKFILVATAQHIFNDIEALVKYLEGSKKMNLRHIPPNDDDKLQTKDIGQHEIVGYISINDGEEQVQCLMDGIFGSTNDSSDAALIVMRIDHDTYEHDEVLTLSLNLQNEDVGKTAYIYSLSDFATDIVDEDEKLYKTTAKINTNQGQIKSIYNSSTKGIQTPSFILNAVSHGGNSGGLIYKIDHGIPIACGIISRSSSESSTSNEGIGDTIGIQFAHLMRYGYKKNHSNDNPLLQIDKMPYVLGFVVHGIIKIVESEFMIDIDTSKKIGVLLEGDKYIPIS